MRTSLKLLTLFALVLTTSALPAQDPARDSRASTDIVATGTGVIRLRPDRASITMGVVTRDTSAATAARANAARMTKLVDALRNAGIPDSAIATSGFSVGRDGPSYDAVEPVDAQPIYSARNVVVIAVSEIAGIPALLEAALASGATDISDIRYESSRSMAARREAIALAVREARADAEAAATAAGGSLGTLRELTVGRAFVGRLAYAASYYGAPDVTPLFPNEVTESAQVNIRYAFTPRP